LQTINSILESQDGYILIRLVNGVKLSVDDDDLRVMDQDVGPAVYAIWSESKQSIVALAFDKSDWEEADAKDWVAKAKEAGKEAKAAVDIDATSFDNIRQTVRAALEQVLTPPTPSLDGAVPEYPWIQDIGPDRVVFEYKGKSFAATYSIQDEGVSIGEVTEVESSWVKTDGSVINLGEASLYAFWGSLGAGEDAEEEGDGLIWKEILHPGTWFKSNTGKSIEVTAHIVQEAFRAFSDGYPRYVSVPADHHWTRNRGIVPPEQNKGFVKKLKLLGDKLFAGFSFTNKDTEAGVLEGSIADVSAYLQPDVTHNATGTHYDWALRHVLLTNNPLVPDLAQWGVIAADDTDDEAGRQIRNYVQKKKEEVSMTESTDGAADPVEGEEITLSGDAATEYSYLRSRGFTSAQLLALSEQAGQLEAMGLSVEGLVAQATTMREKARDLEISRVIAAMEGTADHPDVTRVDGFRHHPVVVEAVSNALGQGVTDLALTSDEAGQTSVDRLILDIANAIPEAGCLPVEADESGGRHDQGPPDGDEEDAEVELSDEAIDQFLSEVGS